MEAGDLKNKKRGAKIKCVFRVVLFFLRPLDKIIAARVFFYCFVALVAQLEWVKTKENR